MVSAISVCRCDTQQNTQLRDWTATFRRAVSAGVMASTSVGWGGPACSRTIYWGSPTPAETTNGEAVVAATIPLYPL